MTDNNTATGVNALSGISTGSDNAATGVNALAAVSSGNQNAAIGSNTGKNVTSGGQNVLLGYNSVPTLVSGSGNIVVGSGADVSAASTANYLNIGGVVTGNMSTGAIVLANGFEATTQSPSDNSAKVATTAYTDAAVSGGNAFQFITSGSIDTSVGGGLLDFRSSVSNDKYQKLILEITNLVANAGVYPLVQFVNQGTANMGSNYGTCLGGHAAGTLSDTYLNNFWCGDSGEFTTDGSVTIHLRGFCNTTNNVLPNITAAGSSWVNSGSVSTCYFDSSLIIIGCNNLAGEVFDGLVFINNAGGTAKHTFDWKLYGIT